jgi:hypothetical protein
LRVNSGALMEKGRLLEETKKVKDEMTEEYERKMGELLGSLHEVEKAFVEQRAKHTAEAAQLNQVRIEGKGVAKQSISTNTQHVTNTQHAPAAEGRDGSKTEGEIGGGHRGAH